MRKPLGGLGSPPAPHLSFRLSPDEVEQLEAFSERYGMKRSDVIRAALQAYMASEQPDREGLPVAS